MPSKKAASQSRGSGKSKAPGQSKSTGQPAVSVLVTVGQHHRDRLDAVASQLESFGMNVAEKFPLGGVIAGEVPRDKLATLRNLKEVATVEEEPTFKAV
jgi:hypothetical protein